MGNKPTTVTHDFQVNGYSLLQGKGAGNFVSSTTFTVSGYGWNIRMYPDGSKEEHPAYMSAFLYYCGAAAGVTVRYSLSLLEKDGSVSNLNSSSNTTFKPSACWGWSKFIRKSKLQQLLSRNNEDRFVIRCVLTILENPRTQQDVRIPVPESDLHTHFASMLKDGEGLDVTFNVGDQFFRAHRCVLAARSPIFKAELFGHMKEATMESINIDDMEPAIFDALLHFIYTDSLPSNCNVDQNEVSQHLLVAADRYGLDRLKAICEDKLCQKIDAQTVATTLALAEQHHSVQLKTACLQYLSSLDVLRVARKTDGFKHLAESCPLVMMDILDKLSGV